MFRTGKDLPRAVSTDGLTIKTIRQIKQVGTDSQSDTRQTNRQTNNQTGRQSGRHTDRHGHTATRLERLARQTDTHTKKFCHVQIDSLLQIKKGPTAISACSSWLPIILSPSCCEITTTTVTTTTTTAKTKTFAAAATPRPAIPPPSLSTYMYLFVRRCLVKKYKWHFFFLPNDRNSMFCAGLYGVGAGWQLLLLSRALCIHRKVTTILRTHIYNKEVHTRLFSRGCFTRRLRFYSFQQKHQSSDQTAAHHGHLRHNKVSCGCHFHDRARKCKNVYCWRKFWGSSAAMCPINSNLSWRLRLKT